MYTIDEIRALAERIGRRLKPDRIILFGSHAKGTATISSDIDLLIVVDTLLPKGARRSLVEPDLGGTLARVDVHLYTPEEYEVLREEPYSFLRSVDRTGIVVFSP